MTKLHFHTEAAIISKVQEALTEIYQRENRIGGLIDYRCAQAICEHWNNMHKRSTIKMEFCVNEALTVYNHIYQEELKATDFFRYVNIISDAYGEYR